MRGTVVSSTDGPERGRKIRFAGKSVFCPSRREAVRREQAKREDNKRSQTTTLCTRCPPHIEADGSSRRSNDEATELPRAVRMDRSEGRKSMKGICPDVCGLSKGKPRVASQRGVTRPQSNGNLRQLRRPITLIGGNPNAESDHRQKDRHDPDLR